MKIRLNKRDFEVNKDDRILDNGACYQLVTQKYRKGYSGLTPIVPKTTFKKWLKEGAIEPAPEKYKSVLSDICFDLYRFTTD